MKPWLIVLITAICAGSTLAQNPADRPPFTLALSAEESVIRPGSEIRIRIKWTNTSDQELNANAYIQKDTNLDLNYLLDVRDAANRTVPKKVYKFPQGTLFDAVFDTLKPGNSTTNEAHLRWWYELDRPGKYTLQVSRRVPKALGGGIIKSNIITITVTEQRQVEHP